MPNFKFTGPYETAYFFPPDEDRPNGATLVVKPGDICEFAEHPELQYWDWTEEEAPKAKDEPEAKPPSAKADEHPEPVTVADQRASGVAAEDTVTVADQRQGTPAPDSPAAPAGPKPVPFQWSGKPKPGTVKEGS